MFIDFWLLFHEYGLFGLFVICTISASILPMPSDPFIISALTLSSTFDVFVVSLLGTTLGALINYYIGLKGIHNFLVKRNPEEEKKMEKWFDKWGPEILIVSPWIPFVGDPMTLVAGVLKMDPKKFLLVIMLAKFIKIAALIFAGEFILGIFRF